MLGPYKDTSVNLFKFITQSIRTNLPHLSVTMEFSLNLRFLLISNATPLALDENEE